jgi:hypothetical protein
MRLTIPDHLAHLPLTNAGVPVPHVASWSSERWGIARMDPLVGKRWALYSEGRQRSGTPLLASINEERQRRSVMLSHCSTCDQQMERSELRVTTMALHQVEMHGRVFACSYAPPTCEPCLDFSASVCPAFRSDFHVVRFDHCEPVLQFVDPSAAPMRGIERFDGGDNPETRQKLGRIARRNGGLVGHVKLALPLGELE